MCWQHTMFDELRMCVVLERQFAMRMKEHQRAVGRRDANSLLALHCLTIGHAFDQTRASVVGNGSTKRTREFIETWKTTPTCVNQCTAIHPCYKALRACWKRKDTLSQAVGHHPSPSPSFFHVNFSEHLHLCHIYYTTSRQPSDIDPPPQSRSELTGYTFVYTIKSHRNSVSHGDNSQASSCNVARRVSMHIPYLY